MGQSLGSTLAEAGFNTLIGMGTVFIVLMIISFIIWLFKFIGIAEKKAVEKKEKAAPAVQEAVSEKQPEPERKAEPKDDRELVAVIAAAIAAYEGTDPDGIVVRSIRRVRRKTESARG